MSPEEKIDALCSAVGALREEVTADREPPDPPSPLRRWGPVVGVVAGAFGILVLLWQGGDYLFQTDAEATSSAAADKAARVEIRTAHTKDMADLLEIVKGNATTNLLQDKDHEHHQDQIKRLERRMARQESRP